MNYKNMFEITKYCKNIGIDLDKELVDILMSINSINEKLFPLLKLESELAKSLLWCYSLFEKKLSSFFDRVDIDFEEIKFCLRLIASKETQEDMREIVFACLNDAIRKDREALKLIISQKTWYEMEELRLACENDAIRKDKVALKLIASMDTWQKIIELRRACEVDAIRQDKGLLLLIASRETWHEMEQIRQAFNDRQKEMFKSERDTITEERARLEQEAQLLEMLRNGKFEEFQDLFQENPDLNGETVVKR